MAADSSQSLALERTFLAHERTLMAWVRTSTSLISFGFTIYKFFAYLVETEGRGPIKRGLGPREFALGMISIGVVALVVAVFQQRKAFKKLERENATKFSSLAEKMAAVIAVAGMVLLGFVLFRR